MSGVLSAALTFSPSAPSEIFPYLVVVIGLENVLVLTKSVVSTPVDLEVKLRIAQGNAGGAGGPRVGGRAALPPAEETQAQTPPLPWPPTPACVTQVGHQGLAAGQCPVSRVPRGLGPGSRVRKKASQTLLRGCCVWRPLVWAAGSSFCLCAPRYPGARRCRGAVSTAVALAAEAGDLGPGEAGGEPGPGGLSAGPPLPACVCGSGAVAAVRSADP